jgi:hypothetical protein
MKKTTIIVTIFLFALFTSCEEVIRLDLDDPKPRLVVDAALDWYKADPNKGANQKIKLTTSTGYYETAIPVVTGATVFVSNTSNVKFYFIETPNTGEYICSNFKPVLNESYTLTVISKEETYKATEKLIPVAAITRLEQVALELMDIKLIEIKAYFSDPIDEENNYLFKYEYPWEKSKENTSSFYQNDDQNHNGEEMFSHSVQDSLAIGEKVIISHYGTSKRYSKYIKKLKNGQADGGFGGSHPVYPKGNIINIADNRNNALGYFSLSEVSRVEYLIEKK